jgi:hypothetical protein
MAYVLTSGSTVWGAETAAATVVALIELLRDGDRAVIRDDAGRRVAPAHLLADAVDQAPDPGTRQALAATLADYVDVVWLRELEQARERWAALFSAEHQAALILMESRGEPSADLRGREAAEVERLKAVLDGDGAWLDAGGLWAVDFGEPPRLLLDELARRHPDEHVDQLLVGAQRWIASGNTAAPADELGDDRARSLISDLVRSLSADDLVEIIAEAVRVNPTVRSKAEALVHEWRRSERAQRVRGTGASSPPPTPPARSSGGRRAGPAR